MNSKIFFILILILAGAVIFGMRTKPKQEISAVPAPALSSQTKTVGAVEVEVTPVSVVSGKDVVFELSMNTHSVELNYDYTQIATLTNERGNSYKPIKWTGGNSGHHLKGELIFASLPENPKELTLTLEDVDSKSESFIWQL